jgi:hypothetical protein
MTESICEIEHLFSENDVVDVPIDDEDIYINVAN